MEEEDTLLVWYMIVIFIVRRMGMRMGLNSKMTMMIRTKKIGWTQILLMTTDLLHVRTPLQP